MIIDTKTTLSYRCPACGALPTTVASIFNVSADLFKLKCDCGGSHLTIEKIDKDSFRVTVPCIACPGSHQFVLSSKVLFNSDLFILSCTLCGFDLCFLGNEDKVSEAIKISNEEIVKLLGDYAIDSLKAKDNNVNVADPQIMEIVRYVVQEMNEEGAIHCKCNDGEGDYVVDILDDFISINCKKCGAKSIVPADSTIAAYDFLNADSLTLE